jgi:hypothetical protein
MSRSSPSQDPLEKAWEASLIKTLAGFLNEEDYRFHFIAPDCIELYLQGKNLTMRYLIYVHNRHLVVRVPGFLRNVNLRRMDILLELMRLMNDFFDIRFELADDGQSLSAACNHIIEDGQITRKQFIQSMMVVAYLVDETYPKLMKMLYGSTEPSEVPTPDIEPLRRSSSFSTQEEGGEIDEPDPEPFDLSSPDDNKGPKIN